jgi:type IV pilus assembly protein PilN
MIRINLLPFRAARKKENIRRQVTVYALTIVFSMLVMTYFFLNLGSKLSALKKEEEKIRADLAAYEQTIKKINQLEKQIDEIRTKLEVIKDLEERKTGPVRLLDQIAMAVPKEKLWLTSLVERGGTLTLSGTAMDNETVALFMTNLEKAELISGVDLKKASARSIPQYRLTVSDFSLECKTFAQKEKEPAPKKKRRK